MSVYCGALFEGEIAIVPARVDDLGTELLFDQLAQPLDDVEHEIFFRPPFVSHRAKIPAADSSSTIRNSDRGRRCNPRGFFREPVIAGEGLVNGRENRPRLVNINGQSVRIGIDLYGGLGNAHGVEHHPCRSIGGLRNSYSLDEVIVHRDALVQQTRRHFRIEQVEVDSRRFIERMRLVLDLIFYLDHDRARIC